MQPRTTNSTWALLAILAPLTLVLSLAAAGPGTLPGDIAMGRWLQGAPHPAGIGLAWFAFWAGSAPVVIAICTVLALVFWRRGEQRAFAAVLGILVLRALNPVLKTLFASPRPTVDAVAVTELAPHFGFPSGHVMGATLLYGGVIWLAEEQIAGAGRRRLVQAAAALVILITGFGRVQTGAHWPSDVLGGFMWGVIGLLVLAVLVRRVRPHPAVWRSGK